MASDQQEYQRVFWNCLMLIGNICDRQKLTAKGVDSLFQAHGADERWLIDAPWPDMRGSAAMRHVSNWMRGIAQYHPDRVIPIARDVLTSLADSGSIVAHQDRETAAGLVTRINKLLGVLPDTPAYRLYHQRVVDVASSYYASGHFASAVHRAFEALIQAVQIKSGRSDLSGRDLMFQVFSESKPLIRISENKDVQDNYKFLFAGAVGAIRNPQAHTADDLLTESEAIEMLTICSHLFRILDQSSKV
jgi:uncharacterized protein (TIGR02391 family)